MVIQGHRVSFVMSDGPHAGQELQAPKSWHLVRDPTGHSVRRCTVLVLPLRGQVSLREMNEDDANAAEEIYGSLAKVRLWEVDLPSENWFCLGRVSNLLYTRTYEGRSRNWDHEFSSPQRLFEHRTIPAWMFRFSGDCVIDDFFRSP